MLEPWFAVCLAPQLFLLVYPHTTERRTTTNLKTKNNQNCHKIELYGSPTTKELKKHSFRLVGEVEMGSQGREDSGKAVAGIPGMQDGSWWTGGPTFAVAKLGRTTGE